MKQRKNIDIDQHTLKVIAVAALELNQSAKEYIENMIEKEAVKLKARFKKEVTE